MRHLMEDGGETVNLAVEDEGEAVYLSQVECRQMMRAFARPGTRVPLHCSAVGKAMLSAASNKRLSKILHQRGMPRLTVKTVTSPSALRADLERVRATGYAVDDEEHAVGLRCIAAPIFDETGDVVAAVSASGPMARISDERMAQLGAGSRSIASHFPRHGRQSGPRLKFNALHGSQGGSRGMPVFTTLLYLRATSRRASPTTAMGST